MCPRLADFRHRNREVAPDWFNSPVPPFGLKSAEVLIVGLAPGLKGANRTGRPFTGDYAGDLLYSTLSEFGFAKGTYAARPDDGLELVNCRITNSVRCVPPQNKPIGSEIKTCRGFLVSTIAEMEKLKVILTLGRVAHDSVITALGDRPRTHGFAHGALHRIERLLVVNSFHCSRYNTNTGRLTEEMFQAVFDTVLRSLTDDR